MLLESLERDKVIESFRSGAKGVFCRTEPLSELRSCIERVALGQIWLGQTEGEYLLEAIQSTPSCDGLGELASITRREAEVAELAAQGLSNKQIAHQLALSEHTVKNHLFHIFEKLHVSNRIELLFLMEKGRSCQCGELARRFLSQEKPDESALVLAAEYDFGLAQLMLGMAHLEGKGVERNDRAAYHWLRTAELNSSRVLEQSRCRLSELRSRLESQVIRELEQEISYKTQPDERVVEAKAA
jgi:DNA-binding CsgD family transcriptional regulator